MKKTEFYLGFTGVYIQDQKFKHICDITAETAVSWVKEAFPETNMGCGTLAKDLTVGGNIDTDVYTNGWLNKLFIFVANDHGKWVALVNWDDKFSIWIER